MILNWFRDTEYLFVSLFTFITFYVHTWSCFKMQWLQLYKDASEYIIEIPGG